MADLIHGLDPARVRERVGGARAAIAEAARRAGREPGAVELLAAVKYLPPEELGALAEAGITLVGENRAQDLAAKQAAWPGRFEWDFIGHLQSRRVPLLEGRVRLIHSLASESALARLERAGGAVEALVEINISGEPGKSGIAPAALPAFLERATVPITGLMTMPPLAEDPEDSRRHFAALRELAARHGLDRLSMGTTQDHLVAVEEGATIVRLGRGLFA